MALNSDFLLLFAFIQMDIFSNQILCVDSSNTAIVYLTASGSMLLSTKFKTKKIKKPIVYESIKHFAIVGGNTVNAQEKCKSLLWLDDCFL